MEHPYEFVLSGRRFRTTATEVEEALRGVEAEAIRRHGVVIGGVRYPVKQAFAVAFGLERPAFTLYKARRVFLALGFEVSTSPEGDEGRRRQETTEDTEDTEGDGKGGRPRKTRKARKGKGTAGRQGTRRGDRQGGVRPRFPRASGLARPLEVETDPDDGTAAGQVETLEIPPIVLAWSAWQPWDDLLTDERLRTGPRVPANRSGVYEVIRADAVERLTIGKAADLRLRVKHFLVGGPGLHAAGDRIRKEEDTSKVLVRWAITARPAAAEEELHRQHVRKHGRLPKHTQRT